MGPLFLALGAFGLVLLLADDVRRRRTAIRGGAVKKEEKKLAVDGRRRWWVIDVGRPWPVTLGGQQRVVGPWPLDLRPLPVAILLAFGFRTPLISGYILLVGLLVSLYLGRRARAEERARLLPQIIDLVTAFKGVYRVRPSVFSALEEASTKIQDPLRTFVGLTVQAFYITASSKRAMAEMRRRVNNVYLNQFLYILESAEQARAETVYEALDNLIERLRQQDSLRAQGEVDLTAITSTTKIIQFMSLAFIFVIAFTGLRTAYTDSTRAQFLFIGLASVAVGTSYYIEWRVMRLKERIL